MIRNTRGVTTTEYALTLTAIAVVFYGTFSRSAAKAGCLSFSLT
jgi:Flp pilus assembly pilin Flp